MRTRREPKVHKYKKRRHGRRITGPGRTLLSVCVTFVVAGVIGVVGYSVAKPILQFTGTQNVSESDFSAVTDSTAMTDITDIEEFSSSATVITTETTETEPVVSPLGTISAGVRVPASALTNAQAFSDALSVARQAMPDGNVLVVPLKIAGGAVLYRTDVSLAAQCGAVQETMSLSEIADAARAQGWIPVAECSLLYDNLLPDADAQAGYLIAGNGSRWLDNTRENGGKPWVSPFSDVTISYLMELVEEISAGGFQQIWCTDVQFPSFRSSDLEYIGTQVQDPGRGQVLVQLMNTLADAAGGIPVLLEEDAISVMNGTSEVFDPQTLDVSGVVLDLGTQMQAQTVLDWMVANVPDLLPWLMANVNGVSGEMGISGATRQDVSGWILYDTEPTE